MKRFQTHKPLFVSLSVDVLYMMTKMMMEQKCNVNF